MVLDSMQVEVFRYLMVADLVKNVTIFGAGLSSSMPVGNRKKNCFNSW